MRERRFSYVTDIILIAIEYVYPLQLMVLQRSMFCLAITTLMTLSHFDYYAVTLVVVPSSPPTKTLLFHRPQGVLRPHLLTYETVPLIV